MRKFLDEKIIDLRLKAEGQIRNFWEEEDGDANIVAVVVLIVVIIAAAGVFRRQLIEAINTVFDTNLDGFINGGGN